MFPCLHGFASSDLSSSYGFFWADKSEFRGVSLSVQNTGNMHFLRAARPIVNQVRRVGEMRSVVQPGPKVADTPAEYLKHFPKVVAKQKHHLRMLKQGVPVHESGPSDKVRNIFLYVVVPVTLVLGFKDMYKFARK